MDYDVYQHTYASLERAVDAIAETSFENWPAAARRCAFATPLVSIPIGPEVLNGLLAINPSYRRLSSARETPRPAVDLSKAEAIETDFFPKFGPVSWKEIPAHTRLGPPRAGLQLEQALGSITDRMSLILAPLAAQGIPTMLHAFPWLEVSGLAEVRMTVVDGALKRGKWQRCPSGMRPTEAVHSICADVATEIASEFQARNLEIDLCIGDEGNSFVARLIEVNPSIDDRTARFFE